MNVHPQQRAGGTDPDAIEREDRAHGWKGRERRRITKDLLYPTKRPSPQKPFIEVAHQNTMLRAEALQQLLDLGAPLGRLQS